MIGNRPSYILLGRCCTEILRHKLHAATQRSTNMGCGRLWSLKLAMGKEDEIRVLLCPIVRDFFEFVDSYG